jgi:hypothetical protein
MRGDLVALRHKIRQFMPHVGVTGVNDLPHLSNLGLAVTMAEMGKDVDRGVRDEIDIVAAASQRALDVAGVKGAQEIQDALPVGV